MSAAPLPAPHAAVERVRIRRATRADLAVVLRHRSGMFRDMGFDAAAVLAQDAAAEPFFRDALAEGRYLGWLAEHQGTVVAGGGLVRLDYQPHPLDPTAARHFVVNMYTEPEWRGRGLARRLLSAILEWCRGEGLTAVYLHASAAGRPLYASAGFTATSEMRLLL